MNNNRDTQFAGFAKAVIDEIVLIDGTWIDTNPNDDEWRKKWELALARRAYDLVDHTISWIDPLAFQSRTDPINAIIAETPDLPELPQADD